MIGLMKYIFYRKLLSSAIMFKIILYNLILTHKPKKKKERIYFLCTLNVKDFYIVIFNHMLPHN